MSNEEPLASDAVDNPAAYFPQNIVNVLQAKLQGFMPGHRVMGRPIRTEDGGPTVGVFADTWVPDDESKQIGQYEPSLSRYMIKIQNVSTSLDEEMGRAHFSVSSKTIRAILYRSAALRVELLRLEEELLGSRERVTKIEVVRQSYLSSRINSTFFYLATTDVLVETESIVLRST